MRELTYSSVVQQAEWVASGEVSARELVEHSLEAIDARNSSLNAVATIMADEARLSADALDAQRRSSSPLGPLHGVPMVIKEENDIAGIPTRYGSAAYSTPARADSEVVRRLRAAGAVIIGTTRMPEFGIWPFTESEAFGMTRNPWDLDRSPAGSSGGTAAAVAAGLVAAGIGGDGGGSIRLPASWCGLFGLKAQRGRMSLAPNGDLWRSLGVIGPITRTVADSALIHDVITGTTAVDRFHAAPLAGSMYAAATSETVPSLRIMVSTKNPSGGPSPDAETTEALKRTAALLATLGHEIIEADPAYPKLNVPFQLQLSGGIGDEAARADEPRRLESRTRTMLRIGRPLRRLGGWAERAASRLGEPFLDELFGRVDLLLTPTTPTAAWPIGQLQGAGALAAIRRATPVSSYTSVWNVLGNPAAAVPAGFGADGMPLSVQVIGPPNGELSVLALSAQLERHQPWAGTHPATA
ncbi:amidase [Agreia sp. Leaf283]|uniref:amidase n=1 Tax=Agreia sp. Leaf283 TaxID=1736321 RepID=UPI0006F6CCA4|nr:amidase [Agreia sp. Leaf283]KQP56804.1 amidase [Agreia sp. Leaf283]